MRIAARMVLGLGLALTGYAGIELAEGQMHSRSANPLIKQQGKDEMKVAFAAGVAAVPFLGLPLYDSRRKPIVYTNRFHG